MNNLSTDIANAYGYVMALSNCLNETDRRYYQGKCEKAREAVLIHRGRTSPDLREPIETAVQWMDAAAMIAGIGADDRLDAQTAFAKTGEKRARG